jgi:hypothetical protein
MCFFDRATCSSVSARCRSRMALSTTHQPTLCSIPIAYISLRAAGTLFEKGRRKTPSVGEAALSLGLKREDGLSNRPGTGGRGQPPLRLRRWIAAVCREPQQHALAGSFVGDQAASSIPLNLRDRPLYHGAGPGGGSSARGGVPIRWFKASSTQALLPSTDSRV